MKKNIVLIIFLLINLMTNAQISLSRDSICSELKRLNQVHELSSENFDILCDCLNNKIISVENVGIVRFEGTIFPLPDTSSNPYRIYVEDSEKTDSFCNGFYWISPDINNNISTSFLFGVNSTLNGLKQLPYSSYSKRRIYIYGGFKQGVPECTWKYTIATLGKNLKHEILKYENYTLGLLDGNYTIMTNSNDTLYHTQFNKGTGDYKDYYPSGNLQLEGKIKNGKPYDRWFYYIYDEENKLTSIFLEIIENGETIFCKEFSSN